MKIINLITVTVLWKRGLAGNAIFITEERQMTDSSLWKGKSKKIKNEPEMHPLALFINIVSKMLIVTDFKNAYAVS